MPSSRSSSEAPTEAGRAPAAGGLVRALPGRAVELRPELGEAHKTWRAATWLGRLGDRQRGRRELDLQRRLFELGLPVPEPLGLEHLPDGAWRLRMALVPAARTAEDVLRGPRQPPGLVDRLARLLAALHGAGLEHGDLHAGNALVAPDGAVLVIDLASAHLGAEPRDPAGCEADLITLAAAWRERLPTRLRQRFLLAWLAALPAPLRAAWPDPASLAERLELAARRRRRTQVARYQAPHSRWFRVSGACRAPGDGQLRGTRSSHLVARSVPPSAETELLDALSSGSAPGPHELETRDPDACWGRAARLAAHGLPGARPAVLHRGHAALFGFALPTGATPEQVRGLSLPPTGSQRAPLEDLLRDRGLELANDVPGAYRLLVDGEGSAHLGLGPGARLRPVPLDPAERAAAERRRRERARRRTRRARLLQLWPLLSTPALRPLTAALARLAGAAARWTPLEARLRRNLAVAYPGAEAAELARLARRTRRHMVRQALELGRLGRGPTREAAWLDARVEVDASVVLLEQQLAAGRGAIIVTPHLGSWELLAATLRRRGFGGAVVGRRRERDPGGTWLEQLRSLWDVETLPQDVSPRELLRRLARGEVIGLLPDLEVPRLAGLRAPFLGRDALVMTAPAALARAARLPLLPARCVLEGGRYRLSFGTPLTGLPEPDPDAPQLDRRDPRPLTEAWVACFEAWIRATPEQWIWYHDRWRTPPSPADGVPLAALRQAQRP